MRLRLTPMRWPLICEYTGSHVGMRLPQLLRMFTASGVRHIISSACEARRSRVSASGPTKPISMVASGTGESLNSDERNHTSGHDSATKASKRSLTGRVERLSSTSINTLP